MFFYRFCLFDSATSHFANQPIDTGRMGLGVRVPSERLSIKNVLSKD